MLWVHQRGVQRQLPQQGERPQDGEPVVIEVIEQAEYFLPLALQVSVVELPVPRVQLDREHLLLLLRQVGGDLLLSPAHDQRPDPAA